MLSTFTDFRGRVSVTLIDEQLWQFWLTLMSCPFCQPLRTSLIFLLLLFLFLLLLVSFLPTVSLSGTRLRTPWSSMTGRLLPRHPHHKGILPRTAFCNYY